MRVGQIVVTIVWARKDPTTTVQEAGRNAAKVVAGLKKAFKESVEDYLAYCASRGEEPDKPFSGQFLTRIPPELHRQVNLAASLSGKSLNA